MGKTLKLQRWLKQVLLSFLCVLYLLGEASIDADTVSKWYICVQNRGRRCHGNLQRSKGQQGHEKTES